MQIKSIDINKIKPYPQNNRTHPKAQIDRIVNSIKNYGFNQPLVVDEHNTILVGHGRLLAAKAIGLAKLPVVQRSDLSETDKRAYRILDNKLQNDSDWELENLEIELSFLKQDGFPLEDWGLGELAEWFNKGGWNPEKTPQAMQGDGIQGVVGYGLQSFWKDISNKNAACHKHHIELPVQGRQNLVRQKYSKTNLEEIQRIITTYMRAGDYFLENCCGWCTFSSSAKWFGYSGVAVDIWDVALEHSKQQIKKMPGEGEVAVQYGDGMALEFSEAAFDFVYCNPPFMDEEKYSGAENDIADSDFNSFGGKFKRLMGENYRVLKPGGLCVITINDKREGGRLLPIQRYVIEWGEAAGFYLHDFVVAEVLSQAIRLRKKPYAARRTVKCHEYVIVFIKE